MACPRSQAGLERGGIAIGKAGLIAHGPAQHRQRLVPIKPAGIGRNRVFKQGLCARDIALGSQRGGADR